MFSNSIDIWCTDGHAIFDKDNGTIINRSKYPLVIGNNCWIGQDSKLLKNTQLSDNSIVGMASVVTKKFDESNVVIAGNPAKIIKHNVEWSTEPVYYFH